MDKFDTSKQWNAKGKRHGKNPWQTICLPQPNQKQLSAIFPSPWSQQQTCLLRETSKSQPQGFDWNGYEEGGTGEVIHASDGVHASGDQAKQIRENIYILDLEGINTLGLFGETFFVNIILQEYHGCNPRSYLDHNSLVFLNQQNSYVCIIVNRNQSILLAEIFY